MAKIEKRGPGWSFRYRDELGQLRRSPSYARQSEARDAQTEALARVARARRAQAEQIEDERTDDDDLVERPETTQDPITFDALISKFLEDLAADPERRAKKEIRSRIKGRISKFFGRMLVAKVGDREIEQFRKGLVAEELSAQTVCHNINALSAIFKFAVREGYRRRPPVLRRPKIPRRGYNYLREEEIASFLKAAREVGAEVARMRESRQPKADRRNDDGFGFYLLFRFALDTGLRKGEIACLRWIDLDLEREAVTVARSFNGPTKSGEARVVPLGLSPGLIAELKEWRLRRRSEWVFPADNGERMLSSARIFAEHFDTVRDRAGIKPRMVLGHEHTLTFHSATRHTFATRYMAQPDASPWRLKKYLGHASITTTEIYAHADEEAGAKDRGIFGRQSESNRSRA